MTFDVCHDLNSGAVVCTDSSAIVTKEDVDTLKNDWLTDNVR